MTLYGGLDIGGTKIHGVLVDEAGAVQNDVRVPTLAGSNRLMESIEGAVGQLARGGGATCVRSLGVGIPGLVDVDRGLVSHAVNLGIGNERIPIGALLSKRLGLPVSVENDVNAAAVGVAATTGYNDLVYLSIGTGLAAGVFIDGALRRGATGAAGEVGHVATDQRGRGCHCGQLGCLETVASGGALKASWPVSGADAPARAVLTAAKCGNDRAAEVWRDFVEAVSKAVSVLCCTVDPEVVFLGGGVAELGHDLLDALAQQLRDDASPSSMLRSMNLAGRLHLSPSDRPIAAIGAAMIGRR